MCDECRATANEALQTGAEINANMERLTYSINAVHATVLVLVLAAGLYLFLRSPSHGRN
jgi:hypothetical protein